MLVSEVILRKNNTEYKIEEFKSYLSRLHTSNIDSNDKEEIYNKVLKELFFQLDNLRRYNSSLRKHNVETVIVIGETEVKISDALSMLDVIDVKIDILTEMINTNSDDLNIFKLMDDRDSKVDEQILLLTAIKVSDWGLHVK